MRADYTASRSLPRRSLTVKGAHQDAEIEPCDMDQVALVEVLQFRAAGASTHAAAIEDMGEGGLDHFSAPAHRLAPDIRFQPHTIGVDRFARRLVAMPTQVALGRLGFGDARLPHAAFQSLQLFARMIALVGDHDAGFLLARSEAQPRRGCARRRPASAKASSYRLRRPDGSARPRRRRCRGRPRAPACRPDASFRPSSWRSWRHGRSGSSSRRSTASCPCASGRSAPGPRRSACRCRSLSPSASASRDSSRRCRAARSCATRRWPPSSSRRRRSARPSPGRARPRASAPSRTPSRAPRAADASACATATNDREPFDVRQPQEIAQREQVRATPRDAPLAVDALEVADHVHAEIPSRRKRRRALSAARNTACTPLQRTRRIRLPEAGPASDRRTRAPASAGVSPAHLAIRSS